MTCKLGRIIRLKNIIRKYSVFVSLFGTRIGSKQASLFVSYKKQIPFLKSNNVEYCRIVCILGHFWAIFTCFLHYSTLTNKNTNNYSFWFDFYDLNQIIIRFDSSVFDIIRLFIANHVELFASFRFVSLRFTIRITSFLTRFDSSQDTASMYSIRARIESQKPLFAQA